MLHRHGYLVDELTYSMILDAANSAAIQAMQTFWRNVEGDYSEDPKIARFPKFVTAGAQNPEHKFDRLWGDYCKARKPGPKTIKKWLPYFDLLMALVGTDDMSQVTTAHLIAWRDQLQRTDLSPLTIKDGYIAAMKAFFGWAKKRRCRINNGSTVQRWSRDGQHALDSAAAAILRSPVKVPLFSDLPFRIRH